jgi:hypothetical protein
VSVLVLTRKKAAAAHKSLRIDPALSFNAGRASFRASLASEPVPILAVLCGRAVPRKRHKPVIDSAPPSYDSLVR